MKFNKMKLRLRQRFDKWVRRKADNDEIFNLIFLLLLGRWFLPSLTLLFLPLNLGAQGVKISPEQNQQISESLTQTFIGQVDKMNQLGLDLSGTISGYVLNIIIMALPYLTLMALGVVLICLFRQVLRSFWVKKK